jgi:ADP-heptose:LPS heptosyltransferase
MRGGRRPGHRTTHLAGVLDLPRVPMPVAWVGDADIDAAARWLPEGEPIIGLGPTANWDGKIWPPARFIELFIRLQERLPGARAAIFAGPGDKERALAASVLAALPGSIDLVGKLSIPEASACLMRCALFVGNDSGLMHLAASAGTPTLGLFGPTLAAEYAPAGWCTAVALAEGEPGAAPMEDLPVAAVFRASLALLERAALPVQTEPA